MLEILISSSVLILVLAILRLALRGTIPARLQYALWLLVLVRLLVPVSFFPSPVSVAETAAPVTIRLEDFSARTRVSALPDNAILADDTEQTSPADVGRTLTVRDAARYIWLGGSAVMAAWFLIVNVRLARRLKKNRTPYRCDSVLPVYVSENIPSPCLFGLFDPAIYLTEQAASDPVQARQIVVHERTHLRHGDLIWTLLRGVCLAVWWFNPLVWLAAALSRQDGELACDEGSIKALGEEARFDYGRTLVGMAKVGARPSDLLCGATTMTTGKKSLKERVARIASAPKMSLIAVILALCVAAVAVGCTYSGAKQNDVAVEPVEPEVAMEIPVSASATDVEAAGEPTMILDPETGDIMDGMIRETEPIGGYDRAYWEEVDRELASFADPADIEVFVSDGFDEAIPEDSIFGLMTLADYIYGTDGWKFEYNMEFPALDPDAQIIVYDADGRALWIEADMDALMIQEADSSVTRVTYAGDPVDCVDMIRHLLPWARGEEFGEPPADPQEAIDAAIGELGDFGLPELEPVHMEGGVTTPFWADLSDLPSGPYVTLYFGTDEMSADLHYERVYWNGDPSQPLGTESYDMCRAFFAASETVTDIPRDSIRGFITDGSVYAGPRIVWYDAENDLLFSLLAYHFDGGQNTGSYTTDELIALAETVSAQ